MDENSLPISQQSLVFRLRKRAEIRRSISTRKSVQEGARDRIADLLEEAAEELEQAKRVVEGLLSYFESSNSIPVERAVIRADSELIKKAREFTKTNGDVSSE